MIEAVIMAGGSGTRFWPLSRQKLPKQFLKLFGDRSLIQMAFDRIAGLVGNDHVHVITNVQQANPTRQQLPELAGDQVIGEPMGRDTAACIGLAAALIARKNPQAVMTVLAADHLIEPPADFHRAIRAAANLVEKHPNALVTFGIPPAYHATGYGYLRRGEKGVGSEGVDIYRVASFHEKPDEEKAKHFYDSGDYYWNSGIFAWKAETILKELDRHTPEIMAAVRKIVGAWDGMEREKVFADEYGKLKKISIDYAVMEKAETVYMVETPFRWDDVGSWRALERVRDADEQQNIVLGKHTGIDTSGCIIVGDGKHRIATLGASDLIIVQTADCTLVANKHDEQAVKKLIARLEADGLVDLL